MTNMATQERPAITLANRLRDVKINGRRLGHRTATIMHDDLEAITNELERLDGLINTPATVEFLEAVKTETAYQRERWGDVHDKAKEPEDWFWLVGYLAGKALCAKRQGFMDKYRHHLVSTAAVLANQHRLELLRLQGKA